ncbi:hypothetical protein [Bifidobacterium dentium]|uniref:hypothetical protein n=1 Tax=Bifidobacterium dentium TaxID=1689 RepID=UPI001ADBB0DE|nr:hypothetical protein [Bifidobacterium dentium]QTL77258.1 hypothetical protein J7M35_07190 [Bifidobacterium dentium]DAV86345.1 MAG TPA: hypothetical protein [Caudoviricetes sp.]
MNRSDYVVQALIDDENMSADLAALYPAASKIGDAAASFIDKADTFIAKKDLYGLSAETVAKCVDICQNVVKEGAAISRLIRNPLHSREAIHVSRMEDAKPTAVQGGIDEADDGE